MNFQGKSDMISSTDGEWILCPTCARARRSSKLLRVLPETAAENLELYCRKCGKTTIINIRRDPSPRGQRP